MNCIVAVDQNWNIGNHGQLLVSIPADMKFFRVMTTGKTIIMGRKTFESFPNGPLPKRRNMILTNNPEYRAEGAEICTSLTDLLAMLKDTPDDEIFVIGGGQIYRMMMPLCHKAYITRIYTEYNADTSFPNLDADSGWILASKSEEKEWNGIRYAFCVYEKNKSH